MSWLSRLGLVHAATRPAAGLALVERGRPLMEALHARLRPTLARSRQASLATLAPARTAPPLRGSRQPAALARPTEPGLSRVLGRRYAHWQRRGSSRLPAVGRVVCSAFPADLPEEPGRRQLSSSSSTSSSSSADSGGGSSRPWWKFWVPRSEDGAELAPPAPLPRDKPSAAHERELHAVNTAVAVNGVILVAKAVTWWLTGSGALLAETLHSIADIMNQVLLRMGVVKSRRAPTSDYPYGFHREKYIYALMSAVSIFCLGAGASMLHGVQALFEPPHLQDMSYSLFVLGGSSLLEFYSLTVAAKAMSAGALAQGYDMQGWRDWARYIMRGRDPTTAAVLAEDLGAVAGLGLASVFTSLTWVTGNPVYDAIGSMGVGALMAGIAITLIRNNKQFLIGRSMRTADHERIVAHLAADPMVLAVLDAKSEELGDGVYRFKAEIQWSGEKVVEKYLKGQGRSTVYSQLKSTMCAVEVEQEVLEDAMDIAMMEFGQGVIRTVGEEIDRLETEMKELVPGLRYVDLETDKGRAAACKIVRPKSPLPGAAP